MARPRLDRQDHGNWDLPLGLAYRYGGPEDRGVIRRAVGFRSASQVGGSDNAAWTLEALRVSPEQDVSDP